MATGESHDTFRFRDFELDVAAYELRRDGQPVRLERQPMDLLILLVERRRQLVSRSDIVARLWPKDVFVDVETGVNTAIRKIRQALGDSPEASAFVETVPGKGYRFIAPVEVLPPVEGVPSSPPPPEVRGAISAEPRRPRRRPPLLVGALAVAAFIGLAVWAWVRSDNSDVPPRQVAARAREAVAHAVRADPDLAEAQSAVGYVNFLLDWNWPVAESAFRRAIALDASDVRAHVTLGHVLSQERRQADAETMTRRARELEPLNAYVHAMSSQVAFQGRDYPGALDHARQAIVVDPEFWIGYMQSGQAYEQLGQPDLALDAFNNAARFSGGNSKAISHRGYVLAKAGRTPEAREILKTLEAVSRERYVPPYALALVHAGLGERDAAFEWLDRSLDARDVHLIFLTVDPKWDPFRADPRFAALLARCDFTRSAPPERTTP